MQPYMTRLNTRKPRQPLSCQPCRSSKLRCDRQKPCNTCLRRSRPSRCKYQGMSNDDPSDHPPDMHARNNDIVTQPSPILTALSSQAMPCSSSNATAECTETADPISRWNAVFQRPTNDQHEPAHPTIRSCFSTSIGLEEVLIESQKILPPKSCCEYLVSMFFKDVSPLLPILDPRTFQDEFFRFLQASEETSLSWLALLYAVCSLAILTVATDHILLQELWPECDINDVTGLSMKLRKYAIDYLYKNHFLVHHDLHTLQALLVLIYGICHTEGVERSWALLGTALHIGIALRCHTAANEALVNDVQPRRLCWAGILMLHTYQAILFRDIDLSHLLKTPIIIPAPSSTCVLSQTLPSETSRQTLYPQLMAFKIRLFQISSRICSHISDDSQQDELKLTSDDAAITEEQRQWDAAYLVDGKPSVIENASYGHWCILQTYAHQLRLLLHRLFHHSRSSHFRMASRTACIRSSSSLLDIHRQLCELPRLRCYKWLVGGMTSFNALHGAIALTSCLLDLPPTENKDSYIAMIEAATNRIAGLQSTSLVCARAYPIMDRLRTQLHANRAPDLVEEEAMRDFDDWIESVVWFDPGT